MASALLKKDTRTLMREARQKKRGNEEEAAPSGSVSAVPTAVKSGWVRRNAMGELVCIVCSTILKNDMLWAPHSQSKRHKENVANAERHGVKPVTAAASTTPSATPTVNLASAIIAGYEDVDKEDEEEKVKTDAAQPQNKKLRVNSEEPSIEASNDQTKEGQESNLPGLPSAFFDAPNAEQQDKKSTAATTATATEKPVSALPEGFFDDKIKDAKARKVEPRDELAEEWDLFKKEIQKETFVSDKIQNEEMLEMAIERDVSEEVQQEQFKSRVELLRRAKQFVIEHRLAQQSSESSASASSSKDTAQGSVDEEDDDDDDTQNTGLMDWDDWRSKRVVS